MRAALCVMVMGLAVLNVSASTATPPESCDADISAQCPEVDGSVPVIFADPSDCGKFCECSNGVAISLVCPPGTLFNPDLDVCDSADDVDCGNRPIGG